LGTQQTFQANEPGYTGTLTATDNCAGTVIYSPSSASGPSATFTVTSITNGSCTITITDSYGQTAPELVTVAFR
jgi:hypothetical protein